MIKLTVKVVLKKEINQIKLKISKNKMANVKILLSIFNNLMANKKKWIIA